MEFRLPQLSMGMSVATILTWLRAEGEAVTEGEPLVEVEADKATETLESPVDGTLTTIVAREGEEVVVQGLLAVLETREE